MRVFTHIVPLQQYLKNQRSDNQSIGFVPTMGTLHEGHLELLKSAKAETNLSICSIYVNPTQFNNQDDLRNYPRRLEEDKAILEKAGCDVLFAPSDKEIYPEVPSLKINFGALENNLEGKFRKGHFNGVGIVVGKLLHIVQPDKAYFGQKDIQQFFIIKKLVSELFFPVELVKVPTVREKDGLAMSSRNTRLTPDQRKKANKIFLSLTHAGKMLKTGENIKAVKSYIQELFELDKDFQVEYFEVVQAESLEILDQIPQDGEVILSIAVYLGEIRLIDNVSIFL